MSGGRMDGFRVAAEADIDAIVPMMRAYYREDDYEFAEGDARRALAQIIGDASLGRVVGGGG